MINTKFYSTFLLTILMTIFLLTKANAQIYNGNLTISRQTEVDIFNYSEVTGDLIIDEGRIGDIRDLDGLSQLTSVGGSLKIESNSEITNLNGLNAVTRIGKSLYVKSNAKLKAFRNGFRNLITIGGSLNIENNPNLFSLFEITTMDGFPSIVMIGGDLLIIQNAKLKKIFGFTQLTTLVGSIIIEHNDNLSEISGFENLIRIDKSLKLIGNNSLVKIIGFYNMNIISGNCRIEKNNNLINIDWLSNVNTLSDYIHILSNRSLNEFCGLFTLLDNGFTGQLIIKGNAENPSWKEILKSGPCIIPNLPPIAVCQDVIVSAGASCQANVTPAQVNNGSNDPDNDPLTFGLYPRGPFSIGETEVRLTVGDGQEKSNCNATVTVIDDTPPLLVANSEPLVLWPPNHKYETIRIDQLFVSVSDNCSNLFIDNVNIISVCSDEEENGQGDGSNVNDIVIADDCKSVKVLKERIGKGNGRVYTVTLGVKDNYDNLGTAICQVTIPHSKNRDPAIDDGSAYTVISSCGELSKKSDESYNLSQAKQIPEGYKLTQNYPNPFNPNTQIKYQLPERSFVTVKIYNIMGQEINTLVNQIKEPGTYRLTFVGVQLTSGIYYCLLTANDYRETIKMILLK